MIKGLEVFKNHFREFHEHYVLIGGAACDIIFNESDMSFRATKDFDMVLIVEALTPEFGRQFWNFINAGGYTNRAKSDGKPQFYRFDKPTNPDFPFMIELFARSELVLVDDEATCRPLHIDEEISSLSAILLNHNYYQLLLTGKSTIDDVTVLSPMQIILFKAKAWLDLTDRKTMGQNISESDIRKHKNDIARLTVLLTGNESCVVPASILKDINKFLSAFENNPPDVKALGIVGVTADDITGLLRRIYIAE